MCHGYNFVLAACNDETCEIIYYELFRTRARAYYNFSFRLKIEILSLEYFKTKIL